MKSFVYTIFSALKAIAWITISLDEDEPAVLSEDGHALVIEPFGDVNTLFNEWSKLALSMAKEHRAYQDAQVNGSLFSVELTSIHTYNIEVNSSVVALHGADTSYHIAISDYQEAICSRMGSSKQFVDAIMYEANILPVIAVIMEHLEKMHEEGAEITRPALMSSVLPAL